MFPAPQTRTRNPLGTTRARRRHACRRGTSVLEMSLVLPLLIMLSFGVVDYGYYIYLKNTFQGAALAGARAGIPYDASNTDVANAVSASMTAAGIPSGNYTVTINPTSVSGLAAGTPVTVTISAAWSAVGTHALSASWGGISDTKQVTASAAMEKEPN